MCDETDAVTGLSPSDVQLVAETWGKAKDNIAEIGVEAFLKFFVKHPEHRPVFAEISGASPGDPESMARLEEFARSSLLRWSEVVDVLGEPERLQEVLRQRALFYSSMKVPPAAFNDFNIVLTEVVRERTGLTPEAEAAWQRVLEATSRILISHLQQ